MAKREQATSDELNLVPIMNLVTILIPFLLMSAQFVSLAIIDSTLPAIGPPQPVDGDTDEHLSLSVLISHNGFTISGADMVLEKDSDTNGPKVSCLEAGCRTPDSFDYGGLTARLSRIKDRFPDEENVILVPEASISYEVLVLTMDATRDDQNDKDGDGKARVLFPFVVIAAGVN